VDPSVQVDEMDVQVATGDRILLCSDGLTGMVPDAQIREILTTMADPQEAVDALVQAANRAGGIDNITAVVLDFAEGEGERTATAEAELPHQPTLEREAPAMAPPARTDITVVGAPIPEPPPQARSRPPVRADTRAPGRRGRGRRVGIGAGITVTLAVLAFVGIRLYLDSQWFVGVSNGRVAVFRGIPADVAGIGLHSVVVETSIPARDALALPIYRELGDGITAADRDAADAIVQQIRDDVANAQPAGS